MTGNECVIRFFKKKGKKFKHTYFFKEINTLIQQGHIKFTFQIKAVLSNFLFIKEFPLKY